MKRATLLAALCLSCNEYDSASPLPEYFPDSGVQESQPMNVAAMQQCKDRHSNNLCMLVKENEDSDLLPGWVLLAKEPDADCMASGSAMEMKISKGYPLDFFLYGDTAVRYCIGVQRIQGYITVSHKRGEVDRTGDMFTWCVAQRSNAPERMMILALTEEARIKLILPHGSR